MCHDVYTRWAAIDASGFLTIHWPVLYNITGIVTQRSPDTTHYLTAYNLQYTRDGVTWLDHLDSEGNPIIYPALRDYDQKMLMDLRDVIVARGLRLHVESFETLPEVRLDLTGYAYGKRHLHVRGVLSTACLYDIRGI